MQINNQFSLTRFMILVKQSLRLNKKLLWVSLAGVTGTMFIAMIFFQSGSRFKNWDQSSSLATFALLFFSIGIVYSSKSFSSFRSKEKTISYLMLPVSTSEKFLFEFLTRIAAFFLIMPLLYLVVANVEGVIVHHYKPEMINYKFSFGQAWMEFTKNKFVNGWTLFAFINSGLFALITAFTGASVFSKSPLIKTLFVFSITAGGYILFAYLLFKGLDLKQYQPSDHGILFIKNEDQAIAATAIALTVANLTLLVIAWFSLKEKEA